MDIVFVARNSYSFEKFGILLKFGIWDLSFDLAQDGELVEPFGIWHLEFGA